jgi:hypothetical protein
VQTVTPSGAVTIKLGMKPQTIGRALGIGLRVAGRMAGERMAGERVAGERVAGQSSAANAPGKQSQLGQPPATSGAEQAGEPVRATIHVAGKATGSLARGVGGFLRPFQRVGGILWLEVTGVFFALPVVVFAPAVWRSRLSWASGPDHRTFLISLGIVLLFSYLSVTSFLRARRK